MLQITVCLAICTDLCFFLFFKESTRKQAGSNSTNICSGCKNTFHIIFFQDGTVTNMQQKTYSKSAVTWLWSKKNWQLPSLFWDLRQIHFLSFWGGKKKDFAHYHGFFLSPTQKPTSRPRPWVSQSGLSETLRTLPFSAVYWCAWNLTARLNVSQKGGWWLAARDRFDPKLQKPQGFCSFASKWDNIIFLKPIGMDKSRVQVFFPSRKEQANLLQCYQSSANWTLRKSHLKLQKGWHVNVIEIDR